MSATYYTLRPRGDTKTNWKTNNPTLDEREMGVAWDESSGNKKDYVVKFGDGTKDWNTLPAAIEDNVTNKTVDTFSTESEVNPTMTAGTTLSKLMGVIKKKFDYCMDQFATKLVTRAMMANSDMNDASRVPTSAYVHTLKQQIDTLNSASVRFKKSLTSSDDMDNIKDTGIYTCSTGNMPSNSPYNNGSIILVFARNNNPVVQFFIRIGVAGAMAFRAYDASSSGWKQWKYVTVQDSTN